LNIFINISVHYQKYKGRAEPPRSRGRFQRIVLFPYVMMVYQESNLFPYPLGTILYDFWNFVGYSFSLS
jgi:hypothetical protein